MQCLDDVAVLDYLESRMSLGAIADVRHHLDGCAACLSLVRQLAPTAKPAPAVDGLTLGRTISAGGMGLIVEAWDGKLERKIALKLPRTDDPALQRRFEREVKITARLQHPAIVPVYAAGSLDDATPYYAMRLVDGESLDVAIERADSLAGRLRLLRVVTAVADAIAYAHSQSIIHRDIKPANVLVGPFGEVVVIDWGLARALRDSDPEIAAGSPGPAAPEGATADGAVLGTPAYMAPEQARGEPVDERADVYALGALLYHVLRGKPPGRSAPEDLGSAEPQLAPDLLAIVGKAMAADPAERYRSAKELATDLERFQSGRLVGVHHYSLWQLARRWVAKHRAVVAVAAVLSVVLAVTAAVASRRIGAAEQTAVAQRAASDDLVGYMLADLQKRLAKVGKLDILEGIGTKIDAYYVALGKSPAALSPLDLGRWSRALDILGDVAYQSGDLSRARAHYERALAGRRQLAATGAPRAEILDHLGTSYGKLARIQRESGDTAAAIESYEASRDAFGELAALRRDDVESRLRQADAMVQIGLVQAHNDSKAARASLEAALAIAEQLVAKAPQNVELLTLELSALSGLTAAAEFDGDLERALAVAKRGVAIAEAIAAIDDAPAHRLNVSTLVQRVGAVAEKRGDREQALAEFERSAALVEQLVQHDPANATWKSALALALARVGDAERALGHREQTTAAYERSLALRQALVDSDPKNLTWLRDLAGSYSQLASVDFDLGQLDRADQRYRAQLALTEKLVAADPKSLEYKDDLYVALGDMGQITHARGDLDGALGFFKRRLDTAAALVAADPSNARRFRLSNAYEDMSFILMDRGDAAGAREAAQKSLALREKLVAERPDHVQWKNALATSYEALAQSQDDAKSARPLIAKAIEHRRALVQADPNDVVIRVGLLLSLMIEARVTRELQDLDAAAKSQADALAIAEPLLRSDPQSALFATYLEQTLEIGGDVSAARQQPAEAARQYRAAIATLEPFVDPKLGDPHIAAEVAEAKWKLSKVVAGAERTRLVREAVATLQALERSKRLAPDRAKLLAQMRK